MPKALKQEKLRIEINLTKADSKFIRDHICEEGENRKNAIERIITNTIARAAAKLWELIRAK